nr:heavy-metal-associated domain-containing protein [uncultured Carboxylicivirga sp.]
MKTRTMSLLAAMMLASFTLYAKNTDKTFKVYGNCGMCEKTIEKAANSVDGVIKADWNKETKMMTLSFDSAKTSDEKVQEAIAKSGYDTEKKTAPDEAYNKLPGCCKYDRKPKTEKK